MYFTEMKTPCPSNECDLNNIHNISKVIICTPLQQDGHSIRFQSRSTDTYQIISTKLIVINA